MEGNKKTKIITLSALIVGIVALSIGFAAFSKNLTIDANAKFNPESTGLDIGFSTSISSLSTGLITSTGTAEASSITLTDSTEISGVDITFTDVGQSAIYDFYIYNNSSYTAYLDKAELILTNYVSPGIKCEAISGTDTSAVNSACSSVKFKLLKYIEDSNTYANLFLLSGGSPAAAANVYTSNGTIPSKTGAKVRLIIEYTSGSSSSIPDGDFNVNIGTLTLTYSTQQ